MFSINPKRILLGVMLVGMSFGVGYIANKYSDNKDNAKLYELREISSTVPVPPGFNEMGSSSQSKPDRALIAKYYQSQSNYDDVRTFYDKHLGAAGWSFANERPTTDWGRDFGGRRLEFRKGEYAFVVEYSGERSTDEEKYGVILRWKPL